MEKAGETLESVNLGNLDLRLQQKDQEDPNASENKRKNVSGKQSSVREKAKLWESPSQSDMGSSGASSARQQNSGQHKFEDVSLQSGDRQNNRTGGRQDKDKQSEHQQDSAQGGDRQNNRTGGKQDKEQQQDSAHGSNPYAALIDHLRATWLKGKTRPMEYRKTQLEALGRFLEENKCEILQAVHADMHRPPIEGDIAEVSLVRNEVNNALNNLHSWMRDERVSKNLVATFDKAFIRKDPYGVVLIISPFNFPFHLTLIPLVGAIAAGNCVIVKPSELSKCSEKLMAEVLPNYLDPETFAVVTGGQKQTAKLLENKFDYIFFTGGAHVGKIVMTAAAKHLTPLTLELGGKNPCYVDSCCDFQSAANRIAWAKFFNAGQCCISPDYVICTSEVQDKLIPCLRQAIHSFYGCNPQDSPDFGRMINDKHFKRVRALLDCGRVAIGGETDECDRYIAPTVLADVKEWEPIMQQEVFGPVLPILTVSCLDEAIHFINCGDRPLIAFAFSCKSEIVNRVLDCTSSGGFCGNNDLTHMTLVSLPFGGIGCSGLGKYHGKFSFDTFINQRSCHIRTLGLEVISCVRYPPYSERKLRLLKLVTDVRRRKFCTLL